MYLWHVACTCGMYCMYCIMYGTVCPLVCTVCTVCTSGMYCGVCVVTNIHQCMSMIWCGMVWCGALLCGMAWNQYVNCMVCMVRESGLYVSSKL
jgi:hypothetical protein